MDANPYTTPVVAAERTELFAGSGLVPGAAIEKLAATKPWVRLVSVLTFIGSGFTLLMSAVMFMMGTVGSLAASGRSGAAIPPALGIGMSIAYVVVAIVQLYPGVKLWKYAGAIARLMQSQSEVDLVDALNQQRGFWKFVGIIIVTFIALYIVAIALVILFGVGSAMSLKARGI